MAEPKELSFADLGLDRALQNAVDDLGFDCPTPIQREAYPVIRSGRNVVGISQTGTGKTMAFLLPILQDLKFAKQVAPRVLILVPTRELVLQIVEQVEKAAAYKSFRIAGVYGGTNINTQAQTVAQGVDILVATPGRLYDLALNVNLRLKAITTLVIDEVDVMLDLGFRFQLGNIMDLLPERRQNIMFSATMTDEVEELISTHFVKPYTIAIAVSGTPLDNIEQRAYAVPNFYTKINLLSSLLSGPEELRKVLVFVGAKKQADIVYEKLEEQYGKKMALIHSNRSQNARIRAIEDFEAGSAKILIATDVIARGLDLDKVSHVVSFNCPVFPENYMHRIGRTGRAEEPGISMLFHSEREAEAKAAIEALMDRSIPEYALPEDLRMESRLLDSERENEGMGKNIFRNERKRDNVARGEATHEKKDKNKKENQGGSYRRELAKKYKKPQRRGDKIANLRSKKKKK